MSDHQFESKDFNPETFRPSESEIVHQVRRWESTFALESIMNTLKNKQLSLVKRYSTHLRGTIYTRAHLHRYEPSPFEYAYHDLTHIAQETLERIHTTLTLYFKTKLLDETDIELAQRIPTKAEIDKEQLLISLKNDFIPLFERKIENLETIYQEEACINNKKTHLQNKALYNNQQLCLLTNQTLLYIHNIALVPESPKKTIVFFKKTLPKLYDSIEITCTEHDYTPKNWGQIEMYESLLSKMFYDYQNKRYINTSASESKTKHIDALQICITKAMVLILKLGELIDTAPKKLQEELLEQFAYTQSTFEK